MAIQHTAIERTPTEPTAIERSAIDHTAIEPISAERERYRFTADQYHQMGEAGIFGSDDRVELIDGEIISMNPIGDPHAGTVNRLNMELTERLRRTAIVAPQNPVRLAEHHEPEPDLAILRFRADFYATLGPRPDDVLLLIEVADSSVEFDRRIKGPLYARNGIPEYWLVDLTRGHVVVYREPDAEGYQSMQVRRRGESLSLALLPDLTITVDDILGAPAEPE
jgi:Uma2 family endonuclease